MRRSSKVVIVTATVILGMLSVFSLSPAGATSGTDVLRVSSRTVQSADIDVDGDRKFSQGDQSVFADVLTQDGERIGASGGVSTATRVASEENFTVQSVVTFELPEGQITVQGLLDAADFEKGELKEAITGGTGAYKNAGGEVLVKLVEGGSELTFFIDNLG